MNKFVYRPSNPDSIKRKAMNTGNGLRDSFLKPDIVYFNPKQGLNTVRILPATWENSESWGLNVYAHYDIGSDKSAYLCLKANKGEACPICEARFEAEKKGDKETANKYKPSKRALAWVIDRDDEKAGPKMWCMPPSVEAEICINSLDQRTGKLTMIEDPSKGWDVDFTRKGEKLLTKYSGIKIARQADLGDNKDAWLEYIMVHPITELLNYFTYEHIEGVFTGKVHKSESIEIAEETEIVEHTTEESNVDKEPTAEEFQAMEVSDLMNMLIEGGHDKDLVSKMSKAELVKTLCILFSIKPPVESAEDKLKALKARMGKK